MNNYYFNLGFRLTYPAIAVHAVSGQNEDFAEPSLFLMIDVNKTGNIGQTIFSYN